MKLSKGKCQAILILAIVLAAYLVQKKPGQTLEQYLEAEIFAEVKRTTLAPDPADAAGFDRYLAQYRSGLAAQRAAVQAF